MSPEQFFESLEQAQNKNTQSAINFIIFELDNFCEKADYVTYDYILRKVDIEKTSIVYMLAYLFAGLEYKDEIPYMETFYKKCKYQMLKTKTKDEVDKLIGSFWK